MSQRLVLIPIMIIFMVACSPTPTATEPPFYTATPRPLPSLAPSNNLSGTDVPLEFSGGQPVAVTTQGEFRFVVRGAFEAELDNGQIVYNYIPRAGNIFEHTQLYINASNATSTQQVTILLAPNLEAGDYSIRSGETYVPGFVNASYVRLGDDGFGNSGLLNFTDNVTGTLTVETNDGEISGRFLFSAEATRRSETGEEEVLEVQVVGEFRDVPLNRLDTPFDFSPIEPTQATPEPRP